ncbi:MAG: polysaccharide export protein [Alphaproteobacteria bacterium]|jgi:polysaccharide export outer membrane protein|nr:polysaccharide export protein [Alphaproteobacteria bacterium]
MLRKTFLSLIGLAFLAACAGPAGTMPTVAGEAGDYRLGSGDEVRVIVFGQPDLSDMFRVNDSGSISMPLLGAVPAEGRTTSELEGEIVDRLKQGLLVDPSVSVEVETYRPFYILGEVENPGQYEYANGMTVLTAVAIAGGFTYRANEQIVSLIRSETGEPIEGQAARDTVVRPGDVIYVYERFL